MPIVRFVLAVYQHWFFKLAAGTVAVVVTIGRLSQFADLLNRWFGWWTADQWKWVLLVVPILFFLLLYTDTITNRFRASRTKKRIVLVTRPLPGETMLGMATEPIVARLAVSNMGSETLCECSARLIEASRLRRGHLWRGYGCHPSISPERGEMFYLRWSDREADATKYRTKLDIPPDQTERMLEVLVLDKDDPNGVAEFAAANPADLEHVLRGIGSGWWKLVVRLAGTIGNNGASFVEDCELLATCSSRDPGPVVLHPWDPRGEDIMATQRRKGESES